MTIAQARVAGTGQQHYEPIELFGGQDGFDLNLARDAKKRAVLARHGLRLLERRYDVAITRKELISQLKRLGIEAPK